MNQEPFISAWRVGIVGPFSMNFDSDDMNKEEMPLSYKLKIENCVSDKKGAIDWASKW